MSIEGKHFYRFKYLKSDHWKNLRLSKLAKEDAKCLLCGIRDLSNDVHHLDYKSLYDVRLRDLIVLCRTCHESVHEILAEFPAIKRAKDGAGRWHSTVAHLNSRKPKPASPLAQPSMISACGKTLCVLNPNQREWLAIYDGITISNPWTSRPFSSRKSCVHVARFHIRHGFHPGMKPTNHREAE